MHTIDSRNWHVVRRLGVLAILAAMSLAPAPAWGQLFGRPVAQPFFDFPNWARWSDCRPKPLAWGYDPFPGYGPTDCACDMPPSVACPGDWVAHRPSTWYATADYAPLTLDYLDGFPIASIGPTGPVVLSSEDLRPEFDSGAKVTVGRRIFDCYRIEGTYMGSYDWQDFRVVTNDDLNDGLEPGNLSTFLSDFADPAIDGLDGNSLVEASFESSMHSAEINLRYWADMPPGPFDVSYLVGVRHMRINEQFNFFSESALPGPGGTENDLQFNTENNMWGLQIGIQGSCLKTARWWLDLDLKGGIYNNDMLLDSSFIQNGTETALSTERARTSWVGDISVVANWQMTPQCTFRIGYQCLFVNGIALAQEQDVGPLFTDTPGPIDDAGRLCYHGPLIGLTWMR
jgi:hypothetical protein